ncbi:DEAD/DEAH box helicase [Defluviimonas salinarum]|uniref:DEAD/DEAH box helicase n=1 Tax=Defluviimonas salinarum TaxID=2992147 RepID=A0ABT3J5P5_9RHOB|nr:DEAD/DEAH box helicase [Defluviimonas salinarum]MCW3782982.1 DEAD/DEAH box helicase [Defluviimonas salinarum]
MPITVNLKKKDKKFEGDLPSWNIVVSGPVELFNPALEKFLFLQGLNAMNEEGDFSVWSSRPAIGAPPLYLAAVLREKYGCALKTDLEKMLKAARSERVAEDGLEHFLGAPKTRPAGDLALAISAGSKDFIANCSEDDYDRRQLLEGAGWLAIDKVSPALEARFGSRPYRTRDPFIAANLETFMPPPVKVKMREHLGAAQKNIAKSKTQEAPSGFSIPAPEGLDYLDFQKSGIQQVIDTGQSAIIADDMGLGKTIQGIGILNGRPDVRRAIFFCQANMRLKWVREIEKWKIDTSLSVGHAEGSTFPDTDVVVINYDIAKRHIETIRGIAWDLVVTDEAHNLKNLEAQRTQAILGDLDSIEGLGPVPMTKGGQIVHLTGTPKPNRVSELWPLLTSSRPDIWGRGPEARQAFLNRYEPPVLIKKKMPSKYGRGEREIIIPMPGKPQRELELQLRLRGSGSFIRRLKRDTDLPPKFRTPIEMPFRLSKEDLEILKQAEADLEEIHTRISGGTIRRGESREAREIIDVIAGLSFDSPHFSEIARVRRNLGVLKAPHAARFIVDELLEDRELSEDQRRKTVVFAHHKEVIATIAALAGQELPGAVRVYDGSVSNSKRQSRIDEFQEDPNARLFIMSLAGATGITLTASARMRVVEPDWSPSNMVQIEDRIWRIGQEQACDIGYLFVPNSLDVKMGLSLIQKMETDERAINTIGFRGMKVTKPQEREKQAGAKPESALVAQVNPQVGCRTPVTQPELPF